MPFIEEAIEMVEKPNVQHGFSNVNTNNSDPISFLYFFLSLFIVYIFRGIIFTGLILLMKILILVSFGLLTYKLFLT